MLRPAATPIAYMKAGLLAHQSRIPRGIALAAVLTLFEFRTFSKKAWGHTGGSAAADRLSHLAKGVLGQAIPATL